MNPSAIQMMPSPVSDAPLFKEGSALAGRSVKSPDGFPAWGMNQASRPAAPEKPAFSQILAEQKAEPPAEKAGQEKTAVNGPAFSEPVEAEGMEKPETASGEDQIPAGQPEIPSPVAVRTTPPSGMTDAEVPGTLPGPGTPPVKSGSPPAADAGSFPDMKGTGKIFPAPPADDGTAVPGEKVEQGSVTTGEAAGRNTQPTGFAGEMDGEGTAAKSPDPAASLRGKEEYSTAEWAFRQGHRAADGRSTGNPPAAGPATGEKESAGNPHPARVKNAAGNEGAVEIQNTAAVEKNTAAVDGEEMAAVGHKGKFGRMPSANADPADVSPSRTAGGTAENGNSGVDPGRQAHSASAAGSATRRHTGSATQDAVPPAANVTVEKAALRTKKISSSAPFEVRRTESGSAQAAAKGQESKTAAAPQGKPAAADTATFREGIEQASPGIERAASGNSGEAQGALAAAKTPFQSVETSFEPPRETSSVLKQATPSWETAAEKSGVDGGRVRIVLSPDHLGTLDMNVRVRKEAVEIMMSVQRDESLHTLRGHAAELRTALSDQGLRVESLSLQTSGRDFQSNGGPSGGYGGLNDGRNTNESGGRDAGSGQRNGNSGAAATRTDGTAPQRIARDGISIFA